MRPLFTDRFLWMIYDFFEATGDALEVAGFRVPSWHKLTPMDREFWNNLNRKRGRKQFSQFIAYLRKQGYIQIVKLGSKKGVLLTIKGRQKALRSKAIYGFSTQLKRRRDNKWLMLIFDIPEKKRGLRNAFREMLYSLGFSKLQQSVWVCPYDIQKQLEIVMRVYELEDYTRIFIIEEIEV